MNPEGEADATSPAVEGLLRHLRTLRQHPPQPDRALAAAVIRTARWQASVRPYAQAAGRLIAAMGDSTRIMAGRAGA